MERVSIISGKLPIIIVSPHGFNGDDENTSLIAEHIAHGINAYAVINRGFERSDIIDVINDKADCNNVSHCHEDVVKEEFLEPIVRYKNKILQKHPSAYIYYIHGMSDKHRKVVKDEMDVVIGFGAGSPNSFTCAIWQKNYLCHLLNKYGMNTYEGSKGGPMSGWSRNNMNQLFRKWYPDKRVDSMQLEITHKMRCTPSEATTTAEYISMAIETMLDVKNFSQTTPNKVY
jgi:hypothetical protein